MPCEPSTITYGNGGTGGAGGTGAAGGNGGNGGNKGASGLTVGVGGNGGAGSTGAYVNTATVTVGKNPRGVAIGTVPSVGVRAYVANWYGNVFGVSSNVSVVNTGAGTAAGPINVGNGGAYYLDVTADGTKTYVANATGGNSVSVIDNTTNTVTATITGFTATPYSVALNPTGNAKSYVTQTGGNVAIIDTTSNTVTGTLSGGGQAAVFNSTGTKLYVGNGSSVQVYDTSTDQLLTTISVSGPANTMAISGSRLFVASQNAGSVYAIDTGTNTVVGTVSGLNTATGVAVSPNGSTVYVSTYSGVAVINAASLASITTVAYTGSGDKLGQGVAFAPDGSAWSSVQQTFNAPGDLQKIIVTTQPGANGTNGAPGT